MQNDFDAGVTFQRGGNLTEVRANREVIVSGGTINSPHILQVSGIGPAAHLQSLGIPVVHDLAGVGANLIDHYVIRVVHRVHGTPTAQRENGVNTNRTFIHQRLVFTPSFR